MYAINDGRSACTQIFVHLYEGQISLIFILYGGTNLEVINFLSKISAVVDTIKLGQKTYTDILNNIRDEKILAHLTVGTYDSNIRKEEYHFFFTGVL